MPKPGTMASAVGIFLPEALHGEEAKSWFRRFEVCAAANEWESAKKLKHFPTLLKGRARAVYEALTDKEKDTYNHLKAAILGLLSPDTDKETKGPRQNGSDDLEMVRKASMSWRGTLRNSWKKLPRICHLLSSQQSSDII